MGGQLQGRLVPRWPSLFYLDASLPKPISQALALVRDDVLYPDGPGCPITHKDLDEVWLPIVGEADWVVIMRDKRIRWRTHEKEALMNAGLRTFVLRRAGNYTRWQTLDLLVRRWPEIEEKAESQLGPYIYSVTQAGLRQML